jgi:hypothetical protein
MTKGPFEKQSVAAPPQSAWKRPVNKAARKNFKKTTCPETEINETIFSQPPAQN